MFRHTFHIKNDNSRDQQDQGKKLLETEVQRGTTWNREAAI